MIELLLNFLAKNKDAFEGLQAIFTSLGVALAGIWAYMTFVRRRLRFPRANLDHSICSRPVSDSMTLIRVTVRIRNDGEVLLHLTKGSVWIQQMSPCPREVMDSITQCENALGTNEAEVQWPIVGEREVDFTGTGHEIEPGESDELHYDFFVKNEVEGVLIYSHIENISKRSRLRFWRSRTIGWNYSTIYDLIQGSNSNEGENRSMKETQRESPQRLSKLAVAKFQSFRKSQPKPATASTPLIQNPQKPKPPRKK